MTLNPVMEPLTLNVKEVQIWGSASQLRGKTQSLQRWLSLYFPCKHDDLSLILRTHAVGEPDISRWLSRLKVPAAKPDNLRLISGTHNGRRTSSLKLSSDLHPHIVTHILTHTYTHTHKQIFFKAVCIYGGLSPILGTHQLEGENQLLEVVL